MIGHEALEAAQGYVRTFFARDASGHDAEHTMRVWRLAVRIACEEGANEGIVGLAALLHDVDDHKISPATAHDLGNARAFLESQGVAGAEAEAVLTAIREVSFTRNGGAQPSSLEAACVRDADRLDAMGAIGIARTFAFGGAHGRALYDPAGEDAGTSVQHFHDKLLKLRDLMCTHAGKRMAQHRHEVLQEFLVEFSAELAGER